MKEVELGEIAEVFGGYAFKSKDFNEASGIPVIKISNIQDGEVSEETLKQYLPESYLNDYENYQIRKGDILVALSGATTGKTGIYKLGKKSLLNQRVGLVRAKNGQADQKYLSYYVSKITDDILNKAKGVAQPNISTKELAKFEIPLPSLTEQKAIVAKLDRAQRLIDIDKEMLAKYDELIQSVFLEMFGDPVKNPKGWERKPMKDIGELKSGGTPSRKNKEYFTGYIDWYKTGELESMYLGEAEEKITDAAIEESSAKLFKKGSLLIGMYDTSAFKLGILTGPGSSNQASANIKLDDQICNVEWLYNCLKIMRPSILHERRGIRQKNLTLGFLRKLEIIMPPLEKQFQFSKSLNRVWDEKKSTEVITKNSEELFSSLVQGAFG